MRRLGWNTWFGIHSRQGIEGFPQPLEEQLIGRESLTAITPVRIDHPTSYPHLVDAVVALDERDRDIKCGFYPGRQTGGCGEEASFHAVFDAYFGFVIHHLTHPSCC